MVGRGRRQPVRLGDRLLVARSGRRTGRSRGPQGRSTGLRRSHRLISRVSRHRVWHGHRAHRQRTHRVGCGCSAQRTGSAACGSVRRLSPRCRAAGGAERANRRREHGGRIRGVDDACHGLHELAVEVHLADLQYRCLERLNSPQPPAPKWPRRSGRQSVLQESVSAAEYAAPASQSYLGTHVDPGRTRNTTGPRGDYFFPA